MLSRDDIDTIKEALHEYDKVSVADFIAHLDLCCEQVYYVMSHPNPSEGSKNTEVVIERLKSIIMVLEGFEFFNKSATKPKRRFVHNFPEHKGFPFGLYARVSDHAAAALPHLEALLEIYKNEIKPIESLKNDRSPIDRYGLKDVIARVYESHFGITPSIEPNGPFDTIVDLAWRVVIKWGSNQ